MIPEVLKSPVFWFRAVTLAVVASLALGAARLTWRLVGWDDGRESVWTPETLPPVGAGGGDMAAILAWAPFGGGNAGTGGLPVSALGLTLKGLIFANGDGSSALISSGSGPVQVFIVGQAPVGNAVIEAIEIDRVILNVGGRREALLLPNPAGLAPAAAPPGGQVAAQAQTAPSTGPAPPIAGMSADAQAALAAASPIATAAAAARAAPVAPAANTAQSAADAVSSMGLTASSQGYVVGAGTAPQLLRAGVRPGDVIRSVNGQPLGNPATDQQTLQRAAAGGRARVEIVRDGRTLALTIPLR